MRVQRKESRRTKLPGGLKLCLLGNRVVLAKALRPGILSQNPTKTKAGTDMSAQATLPPSMSPEAGLSALGSQLSSSLGQRHPQEMLLRLCLGAAPSPSAGDLRELPGVPLRGEGSCGIKL